MRFQRHYLNGDHVVQEGVTTVTNSKHRRLQDSIMDDQYDAISMTATVIRSVFAMRGSYVLPAVCVHTF